MRNSLGGTNPAGFDPQYHGDNHTDTFRYGHGVPYEFITEDKRQKIGADKIEHNASAHIYGNRVLRSLCGEQIGCDNRGKGGKHIVQAVFRERVAHDRYRRRRRQTSHPQ